MVEYNSSLEPNRPRKTEQPSGVSEANQEKNKGWGHRSEIARNSAEKAKQKSISAVVNDRRVGETHMKENPDPNKHEQQQEDRPKSDNHGETCESDYLHGKPLSTKEKAAMKHGENWSDSMKREFLENKTTLDAEAFDWSL